MRLTLGEVAEAVDRQMAASELRVLLPFKRRAIRYGCIAYLAHKHCGLSWPAIRRAMGRKSHSGAMAAAAREWARNRELIDAAERMLLP